jgi:hypothetical protein
MYSEFDQMLGDLGLNYTKFNKRLNEVDDISMKLKAVLLEMEKGIPNDYKMKEGLII